MAEIQKNYGLRQEELRQEMIREREAQIEQMQLDEYAAREAGQNRTGVIPAAIFKSGDQNRGKNYGAVSGTDSESESEFLQKIRGKRVNAAFKWTPEYEEELEEILIRHMFDFRVATRQFCKYINKDDPDNFFELDVKTVQLRWTDIEIRKYRLNNPAASAASYPDDDDDLPEIQEESKHQDDSRIAQLRKGARPPSAIPAVAPRVEDIKDYENTATTNRSQSSTSQSAGQGSQSASLFEEESRSPVQSNIIGYADGSSSEDDQIRSGSGTQITHYNDLEELD